MAISGLAFSSRSQFHLQKPFFHRVRKLWPSSVAAIEAYDEAEELAISSDSHNLIQETASEDIHKDDSAQNLVKERGESKQWKKLNSKELGISTSKINKSTRKVLNNLKQKGHDVYLVGGCVRDLLLKRTPKDFDIITSAELKEVRRAFSWCEIVGKRFPICHVHIDNSIVEVSSFSTCVNRGVNLNGLSELPTDYDEKDYGRWRNCLQRDFTINGFMFDPYASIIYDYVGGMEDLKKAKVQTVNPPSTSFQEDSARILRAIRIAARLGFSISKETAHCIINYAYSVLRLDKGRLLMEVNYMLAYGSAEASLRLLWKFGLLEILLPVQAAYFVDTGFRRRDKRSNMLLSLFYNLDKLLAPNKPCHSSLWVSILAFHKALCDQPQDPIVVAAFGLAIHNGGNISEAIDIARMITRPHDASYPELLQPQILDSEALKDRILDLAEHVKVALCGLTDDQIVSRAMAQYSKAPYSDLVLIPLGLYLRVCRIFECTKGIGTGSVSKQGSKIDYESLALGSIEEVRHVFARIVFDTVFPLKIKDSDTE